MNCYIDESGSFVTSGASPNSWCTVVCYGVPEFENRKLEEILRHFKVSQGFGASEEVKLKSISEEGYVRFLESLGSLNATLSCVATDSGLNRSVYVSEHKRLHLDSIIEGKHSMRFEGGRRGMELLESQFEDLKEQLYIQFYCQAELLRSYLSSVITYFIQRYPNSLRKYRWRIDAKSANGETDYEDSFKKMVPSLLQAFSFSEPIPYLKWLDYSPMNEYFCPTPEYVVNKHPGMEGQYGFNVQKMIRDDIQFVDSKASAGVQVADLLASGMRRLLRQGFENNFQVAEKFGRLMIQQANNNPPVSFRVFDNDGSPLKELQPLIEAMIHNVRPMNPAR